jgi:hypothetical protein
MNDARLFQTHRKRPLREKLCLRLPKLHAGGFKILSDTGLGVRRIRVFHDPIAKVLDAATVFEWPAATFFDDDPMLGHASAALQLTASAPT